MGKIYSRQKFIILLAFILFTITVNSCKSLYLSTLEPRGRNEKLLPPLTPILDDRSFASIFGEGRTSGTGGGVSYRSPYLGNISTTVGGWSAITYPNPRINEINVIFQRDLENICEIYGTSKGNIKCSAIVGRNKEGGIGLALLSGFLLCVPNLFGMPIGAWKSELQIEISIYDVSNNLVGRYTSDFHKQKTYSALYWGYKYGDAEAKNVRAIFTECMADIKRQIQKDYQRLSDALK